MPVTGNMTRSAMLVARSAIRSGSNGNVQRRQQHSQVYGQRLLGRDQIDALLFQLEPLFVDLVVFIYHFKEPLKVANRQVLSRK